MTQTQTRKEQMADLREAIEEIDAELIGAFEELKEIRNRIETLKESRKWRVEAVKFLKGK